MGSLRPGLGSGTASGTSTQVYTNSRDVKGPGSVRPPRDAKRGDAQPCRCPDAPTQHYGRTACVVEVDQTRRGARDARDARDARGARSPRPGSARHAPGAAQIAPENAHPGAPIITVALGGIEHRSRGGTRAPATRAERGVPLGGRVVRFRLAVRPPYAPRTRSDHRPQQRTCSP